MTEKGALLKCSCKVPKGNNSDLASFIDKLS